MPRLCPVDEFVVSGEHDYRYMSVSGVAFDDLAGVESAERVHLYIKKNQVGRALADDLEGSIPVNRGSNLVALLCQQQLSGAADGIAVVDDKNVLFTGHQRFIARIT